MNDTDNTRLRKTIEEAWPAPTLPRDSKERFAQRLTHARKEGNRRWLWAIGSSFGIAASIIAVFFLLGRNNNTEDDVFVSSDIEMSIAEIRGYYKSLMWKESSYIIELTKEMKPDTRDLLLAEIKNLNESSDSTIQAILNECAEDDKKMVYVVSVYKSHLRSLQNIQKILNENRQAYLQYK